MDPRPCTVGEPCTCTLPPTPSFICSAPYLSVYQPSEWDEGGWAGNGAFPFSLPHLVNPTLGYMQGAFPNHSVNISLG